MKHARQDYNHIQDPTGKIPDSEPVFLLRGQDVCAPVAIEAWANEAEKRGVDSELIRTARAWAAEMLTYQADKKSKVPDLPKYYVPDIVPGFGFKIRGSEGVFYIQACDDAGRCLVHAYDKDGFFAWRDSWVVDEIKKRFEIGEYWAVRIGEMNSGRRVAIFDPGAIQTPYEALLGEPPVTWGNTGPHKIANNSEAFREWVGEKSYPFKRMEHETWVWLPTGVTRENLIIEFEAYENEHNPDKNRKADHLAALQRVVDVQAATGEGVQCIKCGNWYGKGGICEPCFINDGGPDQHNAHE